MKGEEGMGARTGRRLTKACTGARKVSFIIMASGPARPVMPVVRRLYVF
jgi:hypothetical protein